MKITIHSFRKYHPADFLH